MKRTDFDLALARADALARAALDAIDDARGFHPLEPDTERHLQNALAAVHEAAAAVEAAVEAEEKHR